ncbi:MAG: ABC transporter permease subunit, partial [Planctomycetia bacterium]
MNGPWLALLRKNWNDARWLLFGSAGLLASFAFVYVQMTTKIDLGAFSFFLDKLPPNFKRLSSIPIDTIATPGGMISLLWVDPVVVFTSLTWAVARGSDSISGEIGRGTMEVLLAQPYRRATVLATQAAVTVFGA